MSLSTKDEEPRIPYQLTMPKEALPEIVVPNALSEDDDRLWVPQTDNLYFRPLCLNV